MKIIANNKKVSHDYFILDSFECGIVLTGTEIKSIRLGKVSISDSYCRIKNYELYILNMNVTKYAFGNLFNHEETRERKLLMEKREIIKLSLKLKQEGMTLIPTKVYLKEALCKIEVALCKGKKQYDKRETAKADDQKRHVQKVMKEYNKK
ncbi:MAG: SsrA-binding protein [Tenericutes bacterium HGW-Tenericutes-1]|jgi:SsrA-binding protein|nr:MAG: SsrA-binding protein [Tenericutes bacterium HGW-Tenericutes-1]